jgi:hypothetical protein
LYHTFVSDLNGNPIPPQWMPDSFFYVGQEATLTVREPRRLDQLEALEPLVPDKLTRDRLLAGLPLPTSLHVRNEPSLVPPLRDWSVKLDVVGCEFPRAVVFRVVYEYRGTESLVWKERIAEGDFDPDVIVEFEQPDISRFPMVSPMTQAPTHPTKLGLLYQTRHQKNSHSAIVETTVTQGFRRIHLMCLSRYFDLTVPGIYRVWIVKELPVMTERPATRQGEPVKQLEFKRSVSPLIRFDRTFPPRDPKQPYTHFERGKYSIFWVLVQI